MINHKKARVHKNSTVKCRDGFLKEFLSDYVMRKIALKKYVRNTKMNFYFCKKFKVLNFKIKIVLKITDLLLKVLINFSL